ncbi:MAG TPA: hypothetical protein VGC34_09030, partial [Steroidobacteraceae bacterium]
MFAPAAGSFDVVGAADGDPSGVAAAAGVPGFDGAAAGPFTVPEGVVEFRESVPAGVVGVAGAADDASGFA